MEKKTDRKKLLKYAGWIAGAAILLLAVVLFSNGMWYQIEEQEEAVVTTFGQAKTVSEKGLHFKIPLVHQVKKVNTTIQGFPIGYDAVTNETVDDEAVMITAD